MRATDILTILSVDMQNNVMYDFKIELNDQLFGVGRIEKEQNKLVLYAAESITIEANQLLTTFMLNKSLNLYKFGDKLEPIYGCRVVGSSLVL
ncbi:hypothetical protein [Enterococcus wangshanyuanii]|uniref:Uncharacterized protein n=1 Tax=Enterococcus wangshanyuanii TaxID=2005703 RepID=A0ABQ1PSL2_9ENTE|nr:hypothetical protein [Enterococcus wangshanyuanii]GGD02766.1 hypothetical protein GCM10011573_35300 [Enterococcus wangshanyuanii]